MDSEEIIETAVAWWHDHPHEKRPLYEFLGMTWEEYEKWIHKPDSVKVGCRMLPRLCWIKIMPRPCCDRHKR